MTGKGAGKKPRADSLCSPLCCLSACCRPPSDARPAAASLERPTPPKKRASKPSRGAARAGIYAESNLRPLTSPPPATTATATMAEAQQKAQVLTEEYQKLQTELQSIIAARQKLESQQQENKGVKREFDSLAEEANIYKLVGPVLLKQEKTEATMAVDGRLEFIDNEMYVSPPAGFHSPPLTP
ncbi:hypothetical protein V494_08006 [Pseudogymnoascus sp. VKM F-4513 (FW-928)]|nr:hypothetical protein V494_08006 [Pseudogymnoascus sp. VKM F-4513 (FW-928)]